jgi:hypothetical protein
MSTIESKFNGYPAVTDWDKAIFLLQQANSVGFNGATKKEIAQVLFGDVAIQGADYEDLPVATSSAPVALPIPEVDLKYGFLANGTFSQPNGPNLVYTGKQWGLVLFSEGKWTKKFTLDLPQAAGTNQIVEGGTEVVNQDGVFKAVSPLNSVVKGGNLAFGILQDISTYSIADTSEFVEVNLRKPAPKDGKIKRVRIFTSRIGDIKPAVFKDETPSGASVGLFRNMQEILLNCSTVGLNTFVDGTHFNNFMVKAGWLPGTRKIAGGALPTRIALATGTKGCARLASTTTPAVGSASNMGIHPMEFAIEFEVEYVGIDSDLTTVNKKVGDIEKDLSTAVFEADFSLKYGKNIFDPSTRVADKYIDSVGNIQTAAAGSGWEMAWIDVSMFKAGDQFTLGPMVISAGHSAWYTGDVRDGYAGGFSTSTLPKIFTYPSGISPKKLGFVTQRGGVANPNIMVNVGTVALPYEAYKKPTIDGIGDYKIDPDENNGGGKAYDQDLNTTDNVQFASITVAGARFPIEIWDKVSPTELLSGQFFLFEDGDPTSYQLRAKK